MSASPFSNVETPVIVPPRRSRRIWLFAIVGLAVISIGWISFVVLDWQVRSVQVAQYADGMGLASMEDGFGQTFANTPRMASNLNYTQATQSQSAPVSQYLLPNGQPTSTSYASTYYANPIQPQDPAEISSTNEINQLRNQLRSASGDQKKELRRSLSEAVGKLFDLRHAAQAKQVTKLETELAEAKELLKKRGERKDEIVERRISDLLQSTDDLAWNREIIGNPNAAPNYAAPNRYPPQPNQPYNTYLFPLGSDPDGSAPNFAPQPNYYPVPQSSLPPQFIPMNSSNSGQTGLLESASSANTFSNQSLPSVKSNDDAEMSTNLAATDKLSLENYPQSASATAEVASSDSLLGIAANNVSLAERIASNPLSDSAIGSKAVIEAAYAYEEALDVAIEAKGRAKMGAVSTREHSNAKRNAAKSKAIWAGICRDIAKQQGNLEREIISKMEIYKGGIQERRAVLEIGTAQAELQSFNELKDWSDVFQKQSIDPLEKLLEQSEEKTVEEKKSAVSSEPIPSW